MEHGAHLDDHKVEPTPDPVVQGRTYTVNPHITIAALDTGVQTSASDDGFDEIIEGSRAAGPP